MSSVCAIGELLMRINPLGYRKFSQSNAIEYTFGGTEFNVLAALNQLGFDVKFISAVPDDFLGDTALRFIRSNRIETDLIKRNKHPLGTYFMEMGSCFRPSQISYNRLHSSFSRITKRFDWPEILKDVHYFHWTGITPGISENTFELLHAALQNANRSNLTITCDPTFRKNLWNFGKRASDSLKQMVRLSHIFIGGCNEMNFVLGSSYKDGKQDFIDAARELMKHFPGIRKVFDKCRSVGDNTQQIVFARCWNGEEYFESPSIPITSTVDRIGTGDAFASGVIYGLENLNDEESVNFANALFAMKHTIYGDVNLIDLQDIKSLLEGNYEGRIKR